MKIKSVIYILLLFLPLKCSAETIYDQPYLGEFPTPFRDRFSAFVWKQNAAANLASIVRQSDLIILAESESIRETAESSERTTIYDTNVKILKAIKGDPTHYYLRLKFKAFTTGIGDRPKHIFFLKVTEKGTEVLKSAYVFPRGQGYDNYMRLFGALDCSEDVGIDVIKYLATLRVPSNIEERLTAEYLNKDVYSAVHMASAAFPVFGFPVLKMAVSVTNKKSFDIDLYGTAAYALAVQKNPGYWKLILENVPPAANNGRVEESIAFDLAANFGDENTILVIRGIVSRKPELAVSAAFALSKLGGKHAQSVIESWLKDSELSKREEKISNGWTERRVSFSTLFGEALEKMKSRAVTTR